MEAKMALDRLISLKLIEKKDDKYQKTSNDLITQNRDITTPALKRLQKQFRQKAMESLENDPIAKRSMTGITIAIDPAKLDLAKQKMDQFLLDLNKELDTGEERKVYQLTLSFFPLEKD